MKILRHTITTDRHELEIFVKYDPRDNTVEEIKSINIKHNGRTIPVGSLFIGIPELEVAVNKIVDRIDWREIYRGTSDEQEVDNELDSVEVKITPVLHPATTPQVHSLFPVIADIFKPYFK